ncbi:MAG: DUF1016 domain-containing protein [Bacteroidetes bacterium HGW-Bacteroidetes-12]|nr:MAG: DUF1016 domain-containing protein [Bacteroidetes bacterium HGW-Bacteroidetes-12]
MGNNLVHTNSNEQDLFNEIATLVEQSKQQITVQANSTLTLLFWHVGNRINEFVLQHERAEYGKQIVVTLSRQLVERYGKNFEERNLRRMLQFAEQFSDFSIVSTLSPQLSWSHFITLLPLKKQEEKLFYARKISEERWSVRSLRKQIETKAYERTLVANTQLPIQIEETQNLFKDPYLLDFLKLKDDYLEKNLEEAILSELEKFILELGKGFTFVERQKRMIIDGDDYKLDLLFFHRKLKRLVVIELKIGKFKAKYKGQMELYLKWLNRHEKQEGEEAPIGLILCTESSKEQIELLEMHKDGIMVAEYWTELPPKNVLEAKLHQAVIEAKERIERRKLM